MAFDALLLLTFGGPEGPEDVIPFLDNVLRGRNVPPERVQRVADQYMQLGGRSPINDQSRLLLEALRARTDLPLYWGTRNWDPDLAGAVRQMAEDGIGRAAVFVPSPFASFSGCRQYLLNLEEACRVVGPAAPELVKIPPFFAHPGFLLPHSDALRAARAKAGPEATVLMTAHSIPRAWAASCDYEKQLHEAASFVSANAGEEVSSWSLVFQSRSGPPDQPWLGPDIDDALARLPGGSESVIVVPLGFTSDHMEVVYDLDRQAAAVAKERGIRMVRSSTPGTDNRFVDMILELVGALDRGDIRPCRPGCCPGPGIPVAQDQRGGRL